MTIELYSGLMSRMYTLADAYFLAKSRGDSKIRIIWWNDGVGGLGFGYEGLLQDEKKIGGVNLVWKKQNKITHGLSTLLGERKYLEAFASILYRFLHKISTLPYAIQKQMFKLKENYFSYVPVNDVFWNRNSLDDFERTIWKSIDEKYTTDNKDVLIEAHCGIYRDYRPDDYSLRVIRFNSDCYDIAKSIINPGKNYIGLHIRRTDHVTSIGYSKTEYFINKIRDILKVNPDSLFYLSTDDENEQEKLVKLFGERIIFQNDKSWDRVSTRGGIPQ